MTLQSYKFEVKHRKGKEHLDADYLSRIEVNSVSTDVNAELLVERYLRQKMHRWRQTWKIAILTNELELHGEPFSKIELVLKLVHNDLGHPGFRRTYDALRRRFWWTTMNKDTKLFIDSCIKCGQRKTPTSLGNGRSRYYRPTTSILRWKTIHCGLYRSLFTLARSCGSISHHGRCNHEVVHWFGGHSTRRSLKHKGWSNNSTAPLSTCSLCTQNRSLPNETTGVSPYLILHGEMPLMPYETIVDNMKQTMPHENWKNLPRRLERIRKSVEEKVSMNREKMIERSLKNPISPFEIGDAIQRATNRSWHLW